MSNDETKRYRELGKIRFVDLDTPGAISAAELASATLEPEPEPTVWDWARDSLELQVLPIVDTIARLIRNHDIALAVIGLAAVSAVVVVVIVIVIFVVFGVML